jgi:tetratricopeptide (TPR) repeat protein
MKGCAKFEVSDVWACGKAVSGIGVAMMTTNGCRFVYQRNGSLRSLLLVALLTYAALAIAAQTAPAHPDAVATPPLTPGEASMNPEDLGNLQLARRHYQGAIAAFTQIPRKSAVVWNKMGIAYQQMFLTDEALKCYEKAEKLDPKNPDVLNNLGSVYYSLKEYSIAEHYYRKAIKLEPKSALIYKNLGTDLLAADKFKKGWNCYQTALAMDPEIFERANQLRIGEPTATMQRGAMNYYLAKSYAQVGMPERAVDYLRRAIDEGFTDRKRVLADKEFASLRGSAAFDRLISEQQTP